MFQSLKTFTRRLYAKLINDGRSHPEYSWGWLNRFATDLCWQSRAAAIRPQYAWGSVFAAAEAKALGYAEVSVLELGVAGGTGLLALQEIAATISSAFRVAVHVHGFDMGSGLPEVTDIRDLPQIWKAGDFKMNFEALKPQLNAETKLILGPVAKTIAQYMKESHPPIGFVSFDMDLYSSTRDAMELLFGGDMPLSRCLPRVACYMDDIMGVSFSDLTGERLAIREYNEARAPQRGIYPVYGLRYDLAWPQRNAPWPEMTFWAHFLDHPKYRTYDGLVPVTQAPLGR